MTNEAKLTADDATGWSAINELARDFADGIIRELAIVAGEYVGADGVLRYIEYPRVVVHAQMQGLGGTSIRLEFYGVRDVAYEYESDVSPANATNIEGGVWEVRFLSLRIKAERCSVYLTGPRGLGEGPFVIGD